MTNESFGTQVLHHSYSDPPHFNSDRFSVRLERDEILSCVYSHPFSCSPSYDHMTLWSNSIIFVLKQQHHILYIIVTTVLISNSGVSINYVRTSENIQLWSSWASHSYFPSKLNIMWTHTCCMHALILYIAREWLNSTLAAFWREQVILSHPFAHWTGKPLLDVKMLSVFCHILHLGYATCTNPAFSLCSCLNGYHCKSSDNQIFLCHRSDINLLNQS